MTKNNTQPSDRIKLAIKRSGLTQQAFANELMVSIYTLRSWMRPPANDSYREPSPRNIRDAERLAERMELTRPGDRGAE